ncbi:GNAT family N-acetyltransferase [Paenibacillus dendritiformis]|nr:GNAT family N-acetyltransferase [Paenibacillus dendritiformis]NKI23120.1 GNAT family N-acetyltransferase [Paenibacillus dendritiformis]NRF96908.1 GNAT family N-acetyltransferase [Paenibacillus dendritiformis]
MGAAPSELELFQLYEDLGWNDFLKRSKESLHQAILQSGFAMHAYDGERLVGTGRVVTDGVINAYLCGVGVHPGYQRQGIGGELIRRLAAACSEAGLYVQLFCSSGKTSYDERFGFETFAAGMMLRPRSGSGA